MLFAKRICLFFVITSIGACGRSPTSQITSVSQTSPVTELTRIPTRIDGINLPHLDPRDDSFGPGFIQDESFLSNMRGMQWNTFRLPISWNQFTDDKGQLIEARLDEATSRLSLVLLNLSKAWQAGPKNTKYLFVLDFHQYKFGPTCGSDGVPEFYSRNLNLSRQDPNCVFKAFHHFWKNTNGMQDGWLNFIATITQRVLPIFSQHRDWLTVGIEPMNEPQPGSEEDVFTDVWPSTIRSALNFKSLLEDQQSSQINSALIPFYQKALEAVTKKLPQKEDRDHHIMIFEPFVWDHLDLAFSVSVFGLPIRLLHIVSDGQYHGMQRIMTFPMTDEPVQWVAAPHHYDGTVDSGLLDSLPSNVGDILSKYPNEIFDRESIAKRMALQRVRMRESGMDRMYFGEWGTPTDLKSPDGSLGGAKSWIKDSRDAMAQNSDGGLWWRYEFDESQGQDSYYLLQGHVGEERQTMGKYEQRLKCGKDSDLTALVFGRCLVP